MRMSSLEMPVDFVLTPPAAPSAKAAFKMPSLSLPKRRRFGTGRRATIDLGMFLRAAFVVVAGTGAGYVATHQAAPQAQTKSFRMAAPVIEEVLPSEIVERVRAPRSLRVVRPEHQGPKYDARL